MLTEMLCHVYCFRLNGNKSETNTFTWPNETVAFAKCQILFCYVQVDVLTAEHHLSTSCIIDTLYNWRLYFLKRDNL